VNLDEMKAMARRLPDEISRGNVNVLDQVTSPNAVDHALPPGMPQTVDGAKQFFTMFLAAFPDLHYWVEDMIAEGDKVVHRITGYGTMKGSFLGMPATGKSATWTEMHIVRFADGKIVEHWGTVDQLAMLQQLGLAPMPGGD
jgi:predicted ester cyclase